MAPKGGKTDKRHGDPEEGGLTTGREIKFLEDHPEKQGAVDAYKEELAHRQPGSPKSPKSPKGKKKSGH
ncbi:poly [ADP-ribose] polymerase 14 isoform X1 [Chlorella sorokiniana]|uniref:Poly [ADP-ribose] polymerase 14 isoform X1 n=1 Tax=Chlorella sorokiniana TaxID=3076 RepID=A0A2P6TZQ4_CHLSO|nr:poly [ADP-ribose] polymerase 14 isoform X1 [Chlorella sorokiniana]|eukprot:PRW59538.1 poly [ADP-ribose] polymerase 14 isoform X1 [Chlorella sorokiniana]